MNGRRCRQCYLSTDIVAASSLTVITSSFLKLVQLQDTSGCINQWINSIDSSVGSVSAWWESVSLLYVQYLMVCHQKVDMSVQTCLAVICCCAVTWLSSTEYTCGCGEWQHDGIEEEEHPSKRFYCWKWKQYKLLQAGYSPPFYTAHEKHMAQRSEVTGRVLSETRSIQAAQSGDSDVSVWVVSHLQL